MNARSFCILGHRFLFHLSFSFCFLLSIAASPGAAQTTQPYLFAATPTGSSNSSGLVTLLRNGTTGVLTLVPNTSVSFNDSCSPTTIDPTGNFLFGVCGDGVSMYTLDSSTGLVTEVAASPFAASVSTDQTGVLVAAESTGQYVYLLKVGSSSSPVPSTFTFDTFQIDPTTPGLVPVNSQSLPLNGTWVQSAADPSRHGIFIFVNQEQGEASPTGLLFTISFDLSSGLATVPTDGLMIGSNARSLAISPSGSLALGWGDSAGSFTIYQVSTSDFSMSLVGSVNLGLEDASYGSYSFPDSLYFSPGGNLLYVQAPPADFAGGGLPFLVFDPVGLTQVAAPIQLSDASFLNGLPDPQAPFTYVSNAGPSIYGVSVYEVDLSTGFPSQPAPISSPFFPQMSLSPLFVTVEQTGQGIQGATLGASPGTLTFGSITAGQTSGPQNIVLKSLGAQPVTLSSVQISGENAADFSETENCAPVLPTNHGCIVAVSYSPSSPGTSIASLTITDNAAGSPQSIPLSGAAVAAPPSGPAVSLNPAPTLTFPGTPTQGTTTTPQIVTLTNSGGAPLQILSSVLTGFNAGDFAISSDNCTGSIAAGANCAISLVFSPQASGVRTTNLTITDNAASSPQSITLSGTATAAASVSISSGGSATATVAPGQTAQFKLQVTPGAGFSGTLAFTCSGAPFGATCTVPGNTPISNGTPVSFAVSVSTLGASPSASMSPISDSPDRLPGPLFVVALLFALFTFSQLHRPRRDRRWECGLTAATATLFSFVLTFSGIGCGSASVGSAQSTAPAQNTTATPTIQPAGGTFGAAQSVSITDSTAGATIYYTIDGTTPTSSSAVYSAALSLSSSTTVQVIAAAANYANSSIASAVFNFQTPAGSYPITVNVTATPIGSSKPFQLAPITLTLVVN
jgi:hypothetical protein